MIGGAARGVDLYIVYFVVCYVLIVWFNVATLFLVFGCLVSSGFVIELTLFCVLVAEFAVFVVCIYFNCWFWVLIVLFDFVYCVLLVINFYVARVV